MSSESNTVVDAIDRCTMCRERSTWDFLRDFYMRVDAAHQYARLLEHDLHNVRLLLQKSQQAVTDCESRLAICQDELYEERLYHSVSRGELNFERERHKETDKLFEIAYDAAQQNSELVKDLRHQIALSQGISTSEEPVKTMNLQLQLQNAKEEVRRLEDMISSESSLTTHDWTPAPT